MTIIHINIGLGGGGAEHIILELAKRGNQDGVRNIVIAISNINEIEHKFKKNNIEVHYLNIDSIRTFFKGIRNLNTILKPLNDVVLHCHMVHGLLVGVYYRLRYKKLPIIFTLHNILVEHIYRRYLLFFTKPFREVDINFSSDSDKWYLKPVEVIANGVDFSAFHNTNEREYNDSDKFVFLFLGRIEEQKHPLVLVDFVKKMLAQNVSDFVINVVGDGLMRNQLEELIKTNSYEDYINILGFQNNIKEIMETSHCLILPSLWEGLPVSLIEASASKLPIVTTPVGSIPEYFNESNCSISSIENFHLAMIEVKTNYNLAKIRANKLFEDNKNVFDINTVYFKHKSLYQKHLKSSSTKK